MDGSGERMRMGVALRASKGQGHGASESGGSVARVRAKRALWARPVHARQAFGKMPMLAKRLQIT